MEQKNGIMTSFPSVAADFHDNKETGINLVSGKLPIYSFPKPTFFPQREVSVNVGLGEE